MFFLFINLSMVFIHIYLIDKINPFTSQLYEIIWKI